MSNNIFITGAGIVSAAGCGKAATLAALHERRTGIGAVRYLDTVHTALPVGEVKMSNAEMVQLLGLPACDVATRTSLLGRIALREAAEQAQLGSRSGLRVALLSGTTVGGMDKSEQYYASFLNDDTRNGYIAYHDCGPCTDLLADYYDGLFTMVQTISTACSSAANAIMVGAELLRAGRADVVVAGGCECLTKYHLNGFNALKILDSAVCKPFDAHRGGLNLGEGAGYIVLETEATLGRQKGVEPLCRLTGYANACDAFHQTATSPNGEGAYLAMAQALRSAGLAAADIDYVNAHGTGTSNNDLTEGIALQRVFAGVEMPPVSSTKSFTGHTTSAAGGVEAVIALLALQHSFVPVNLNFSVPMPELSFTPAVSEAPRRPLRHVLSSSFGFGGNDTSLIFSKV